MYANTYVENPMTLGEYPGNIEDVLVICPCCKRKWYGYVDESRGTIEWDCGADSITTDDCDDPIGNGCCPACALDNRTLAEEIDFIETYGYEKRVIAYALCNNAMYSSLHNKECCELWALLKERADDYLWEITDAYINDHRYNEFIDWKRGL